MLNRPLNPDTVEDYRRAFLKAYKDSLHGDVDSKK